MERPAIRLRGDLINAPTRRRAGVFRRALRREASRLRDRRRILAMTLLIVTFGLTAAGMIARGEAAGADARAYWAGVRFWLNGGDPYHPAGPFLPYVYSPWMLPLFAPWALLPWDVAWFVWRGGTILSLLWTIDWAYRRRPLATAITVAALAFPIGANLDTGNITLLIALALFGAQFVGPRWAGAIWGLATWMKWAPAVTWVVLAPRARLWGLAWLVGSIILSLATLPATIAQLEALFSFDRPLIRLDYLVLLWAFVPWLWRREEPFAWLRPATWQRALRRMMAWARIWGRRVRADPVEGSAAARRGVVDWARGVLGLEARA
jgi:Glycosyltransferase family 87